MIPIKLTYIYPVSYCCNWCAYIMISLLPFDASQYHIWEIEKRAPWWLEAVHSILIKIRSKILCRITFIGLVLLKHWSVSRSFPICRLRQCRAKCRDLKSNLNARNFSKIIVEVKMSRTRVHSLMRKMLAAVFHFITSSSLW